MKIKLLITSLVVMVATFGAGASASSDKQKSFLLEQIKPVSDIKLVATGKKTSSYFKNKEKLAEYLKQNSHTGKKRYIIRLTDAAVASYNGGVKGLKAVNNSTKKNVLNNVKFNAKSAEAIKYIAYLEKQQNTFSLKAATKIGRTLPNLRSYKYAINGILTELTYKEAKSIAKMAEVAFIEQDKMYQLETDTGPVFIGAGNVWDGTAGGSSYMGEGTIIGMIDTGINTDHRSFAATGDDGFTVTNPFGDGVYVGDCVADATLCNSKLIGVRSYSQITDTYSDPIFDAADQRPANGEDYNGHGSHTSSTAGGNVLLNVPLVESDPASGNTGDGIATSLIFPRMSGVAPHANIISYQVCLPGDSGDTFAGCFGSATLSAIDDAIADGVDVINYSIGGTVPFSPWTSSVEIGFLNANAAGIFVATSAGNSGPTTQSPTVTTKVSPWYAAVAASTHGRSIVHVVDFDGNSFNYAPSADGPALTADLTAPVVYSGDVDTANFDGCSAFTAGSFTGSIALISRGTCSFTSKIDNAAAAGALAVIVFNNRDGDVLVNMTTGATAISSIFVSENSGNSIVASLAATAGLVAAIDADAMISFGQADVLAGFSSRGPNSFAPIITPQVTAPGVNVYAAFADDTPFHDVVTATPADFAFLSGTSMASPHIAGSAALLTQAHSDWNPDQIRSALMMTATTSVLKEDGVTAASAFDMGSGRVQVDKAINAGLVMSESQVNYLAADPATGGNPSTLNLPSLANFGCSGTCTWTRNFTAVTAGTYSFTSDNTDMTITPASVDATEGENFSVTFSLDASALNSSATVFATINIASTVSPDLHMPVFASIENGTFPEKVDIQAGRDNGSYLVTGIKIPFSTDLTFTLDGLFDANATGATIVSPFSIAVDSDNTSFSDDFTDGVFFVDFEVTPNTASLNVAISEATADDNDLYVLKVNASGGFDNISGFDGATGATNETLSFSNPEPGMYRAVVQNFASTSGLAEDTGVLTVEVVPITDPLPGLSIQAPNSSDGLTPIDIRLVWDREMKVGDSFFGDITVKNGETEVGNFPITLKRVSDDVTITANTVGPVERGDVIDYTIHINRNLYKDILDYNLTVDMPEGSKLLPDSVVVTGGDTVIKDPNAAGLNLSNDFDIAVDSTNNDPFDDLSQVFVVNFDVPKNSVDLTVLITQSTAPDLDLFVQQDVNGDGNFSTVAFAATALATETVTISSPSEGAYRIIVQNFTGSSAATDTGTVVITTTPAKGEGFLWNAQSPLSFDSYSVVSSANEPLCDDAGFGGYVALEGFGIPTAGAAGDTVTFGAFSNTKFKFFGVEHDGLSFTDDGFIFFSGASGATPWINAPIPSAAEPNDMIAAFWKDLEIFDDGTRGIRLASAGPLKVVEFDEIGSFDNDADKFSYELIADTAANDAPGSYEYIIAYSPTQSGNFTGMVAGVEGPSGLVGIDATSLVQPGVQLCYDAITDGKEFEITFSVLTTDQSVGNPITPKVLIESNLVGAQDLNLNGDPVALVNVGPTADAGPDLSFDRITDSEATLNAVNSVDLDGDRLSYRWTQTSGKPVNLRGGTARQAFFDIGNIANGDYTFELTVSDGQFVSNDSVKVTVTGKSLDSTKGSGSPGLFLLILLFPFLLRKRYYIK